MKAVAPVLRRVPQPQLTALSVTSPENVPVGRLGVEKSQRTLPTAQLLRQTYLLHTCTIRRKFTQHPNTPETQHS